MNSPNITAYQFTVKATVSLEIHAESYAEAYQALRDTISGGFDATPVPMNLMDGYTMPDPDSRPELIQVYDESELGWRDATPEDMAELEGKA